MNREPVTQGRLITGYALAPIVAAASGFALFPLVDLTGYQLYGSRSLNPLDAALSFGAGVGLIATVITLAGGIPIGSWLWRRGRFTPGNLLIAGLALGNAPFLLVICVTLGRVVVSGASLIDAAQLWYGSVGAVRAAALGSAIGAISALAPWVTTRSLASGR